MKSKKIHNNQSNLTGSSLTDKQDTPLKKVAKTFTNKTTLTEKIKAYMPQASFEQDSLLEDEIPELEEILNLPPKLKEQAFVRAACTAHKTKNKAKKRVRQTLAWIHRDSEN